MPTRVHAWEFLFRKTNNSYRGWQLYGDDSNDEEILPSVFFFRSIHFSFHSNSFANLKYHSESVYHFNHFVKIKAHGLNLRFFNIESVSRLSKAIGKKQKYVSYLKHKNVMWINYQKWQFFKVLHRFSSANEEFTLSCFRNLNNKKIWVSSKSSFACIKIREFTFCRRFG